jgi:hypothetical protein
MLDVEHCGLLRWAPIMKGHGGAPTISAVVLVCSRKLKGRRGKKRGRRLFESAV